MSAEQATFWQRTGEFFEWLLALRITDDERLVYASDPQNIFADDISGKRPLRVAAAVAILFHVLMLVLYIPGLLTEPLTPTDTILNIVNIARPARLSGSEGAPPAKPKPKVTKPKPKPRVVPIPDPTPNAPEPIRKDQVEVAPEMVAELDIDLSLDDIAAPPGPVGREGDGRGQAGGRGRGTHGDGDGTGDGGGVYRVGGGITNPMVLVQTTPSYTDEAIKAKVQGVVLLQAVIRKSGRADSFKVLRGLGYGLEENAIKEIAANWRFRPARRNNLPVDVYATIEVSFTLR